MGFILGTYIYRIGLTKNKKEASFCTVFVYNNIILLYIILML